jgi:hypothetical protein
MLYLILNIIKHFKNTNFGCIKIPMHLSIVCHWSMLSYMPGDVGILAYKQGIMAILMRFMFGQGAWKIPVLSKFFL